MFYDVFIRLCKDKGVSLSRAAEDNGLNRSAVVKWRKGAVPSGTALARFSSYFGVTSDYLLEKTDAKFPPLPAGGLRDAPEEIIILNRAARKMTPEQRRKLLEMAQVMFKEEFEDNGE